MSARIVVDLDGTLCRTVEGDYARATPIIRHISAVNRLFDEGNYIHIFTARGMSTFHGIKVLAILRWKRLTRKQLRAWSVKYHKLSLGKPAGDFYVDDKGFFSEDFFENAGRPLSELNRP